MVAAEGNEPGYLPGLDGLRALAVSAVLIYHADLPWLPGGFLGVEVFFVISGYLITLLLRREADPTGGISLRGFWTRRARRLLPAAYTLVLTVAAFVLVFYRDEAARLAGQVWSAFFYVTNWYFIASEQSYFAATERPDALQHLWSLAIEEQFYLVWPLVMLGLTRWLGGREHVKALVISAAGVVSIMWMATLHDPVGDPSRIYYGTDTRASGLLFGAALAFLWRPRLDWDRTGRQVHLVDVLGGLGVGVLVWCALDLSEFDRRLYPTGFALVSLGTVLAIMAAVHPASVWSRLLLSGRVLRWIGLRSYSLYLWHWPLFVFTRPEIDQPLNPVPTLILRLIATAFLAELSYRYVETPIRAGAIGRWWKRLARRPALDRYAPLAIFASLVALIVASITMVPDSSSASEERLLAGAAATVDVGVTSSSASPTGDSLDTSGAAMAGTSTTAPVPAARPVVTVLGDSVLKGAQNGLTAGLEALGYDVDYRATPAWMLPAAANELSYGGPVGDLVIIGLGHNTLWERDRVNYDEVWAPRFDREADRLLETLRELGGEHFIWVTLRDPADANVPAAGRRQIQQYLWYFPYVNERLHALVQRHPDVELADWTAVSDAPGLTYDAMHLTDDGIELMVQTITEHVPRVTSP